MGSEVHPSGVIDNDKTVFSSPKITAVEGNNGEQENHELHPQIPGWFAEHCPIWPGWLIHMNKIEFFFFFYGKKKHL